MSMYGSCCDPIWHTDSSRCKKQFSRKLSLEPRVWSSGFSSSPHVQGRRQTDHQPEARMGVRTIESGRDYSFASPEVQQGAKKTSKQLVEERLLCGDNARMTSPEATLISIPALALLHDEEDNGDEQDSPTHDQRPSQERLREPAKTNDSDRMADRMASTFAFSSLPLPAAGASRPATDQTFGVASRTLSGSSTPLASRPGEDLKIRYAGTVLEHPLVSLLHSLHPPFSARLPPHLSSLLLYAPM
eukprot:1803396-Rhodomonas_salina.1